MKLLIVDDERISLEGMANYFNWSEIGIEEILVADNGKKALEIVKKEHPEILITDIKMPIMNGLELIKEIRKFNVNMKIILLSAYGEFDFAKTAISLGVQNYLLKPIDETEFKKVINKIVEEVKYNTNSENNNNGQKLLIDILNNRDMNLTKNDDKYLLFISEEQVEFDAQEISNLLLATYYEGMYVTVLKYADISHLWMIENEILKKDNKVFFGKICTDIHILSKAYKEAVTTKKLSLFWKKPLNSYVKVEKQNENFLSNKKLLKSEQVKFIQIIILLLKQQNKKKLEESLERLKKFITHFEGTESYMIEKFFLDLMNPIFDEFSYLETKNDNLWKFTMRIQESDSVDSMMTILYIYLGKILFLIDYGIGKKDDSIVKKVIRIIENEYSKDIGLHEISERVYLSPNYLGNIFKQETGLYFNDFLTDYRLKKGRIYLLETNEKVTEIGKKIGINNNSYFSLLFKKKYGMTPREYRQVSTK